MATHDYIISNASGAAVRADLNNALAAIVSNNSNASSPSTTYAYQWWADTTTGQLKIRNAANSAWIVLMELDGTMLMADGTAASPGLAFASDLNTGFFRSAADKIGFATNGVERLRIGSSEVVFNEGSNDVDFRVESNGNANMLFVDGGNDAVRIGTSSSPYVLTADELNLSVGNATDHATIQLYSGTNKWGAISFNDNATDGSNAGLIGYYHPDNYMVFNTNSAERMRIDSSGRMLVGTSTSTTGASSQYANLQVIGNLSSATNRGALLNLGHSAASASVTTGELIGSVLFTDNAAGEYGLISCLADGNASSGDYPGRLVFSTTADGASSSTERMRLDSSGNLIQYSQTTLERQHRQQASSSYTATNIRSVLSGASAYLAFDTGTNWTNGNAVERLRIDSSGNLLVGNTNATGFVSSSSQTGVIAFQSGVLAVNKAGDDVASFNRLTSDGTIVSLRQAGTQEGEIRVSGTTVSYLGGHLSRWSQTLTLEEHSNLLKGTVMTNLDEMCEWENEDNEQLNKMAISTTEGDPNVAGVIVGIDEDNDLNVGMTGDMVIRIAQGTTVARGDLLMSAGDGTAKPQDDDIVRSKTIAKVTSTTVSTTYSDNSYCVPCVLMAC